MAAIWRATKIGGDHILQMADCHTRWRKKNLIYSSYRVDYYRDYCIHSIVTKES